MRKAAQNLSVLVVLLLSINLYFACPTSADSPRIEGVVLDELGGVIPDSSVRLISAESVRETLTDQAGRFTFADLPEGIYELQVLHSGFNPEIINKLTIPATRTQPISVTLRVSATGCPAGMQFVSVSYKPRSGKDNLVGLVHDLFDGPLRGATVTLLSQDAKRTYNHKAGSDGAFRFEGVVPGKYYLEVTAEGYSESGKVPIWIVRDNVTRLTPIYIIKKNESRVIICQ
jgi:carboxypeptidase family protein